MKSVFTRIRIDLHYEDFLSARLSACCIFLVVWCDSPKLKKSESGPKDKIEEPDQAGGKKEPEMASEPRALMKLPVTRTLTDDQGRSFKAEVLGKSAGYLSVRRESDGKRFSVSVKNLSLSDQTYFSTVADSTREEIAKLRQPTNTKT